MNDLSWFIYLADIVARISGVSFAFAFAFGAATISSVIAKVIAMAEEENEVTEKFSGLFKFAFLGLLVALFVLIFVPSRDTLYLIAGSEAGEAVVTSEEGKAILKDIQDVIQHQLGQLKGDK